MLNKVEIKNTEVETFTGVAKASGKPFSMSKQKGWFYRVDEPYPEKIEIILKDATKPYPIGVHSIDYEKSVYVDRNGRLSISPVLIINGGSK